MERFAPAKRQASSRTKSSTALQKFLLFRVGEEIYGIGLRGLREVLSSDGVASSPSSPSQVCVTLEHRGRKVPVIHMGALFGGSHVGSAPSGRVLLAQGKAGPLGLLVDEVLEIAEVESACIGPLPALATLLDPSCFRGLFARQGRIILLINEDGLAGLDEVVQLYATAR